MAATPVLNQSVHQGTVYSSSSAWPQGSTSVTAAVLLSDQDAGNGGNQFTLAIETSFDGGLTWSTNGQVQARCGTPKRNDTGQWALPALKTSYSSSQVCPSNVRVRLDLPSSLSIGATLEFA